MWQDVNVTLKVEVKNTGKTFPAIFWSVLLLLRRAVANQRRVRISILFLKDCDCGSLIFIPYFNLKETLLIYCAKGIFFHEKIPLIVRSLVFIIKHIL